MRIQIRDIRTNFSGFERLARLATETDGQMFADIEIDMGSVRWLEANVCAALGAVLYRASRGPNTVRISNVRPEVETILSKNGFLRDYGRQPRVDTYGTTIEYLRLEPDDDRFFGNYIDTGLRNKGLPAMSPGLWRKFRESIFEIFSNSAMHSGTEFGIFSCGQFFPRKGRLDFAIADLGIGICRNVNETRGLGLTPEQAIDWAMEGRNTTKTGPIPGGLGLKLLREFITMNRGRIQIASDLGYWELRAGQVTMNRFTDRFPGTVVNIEVNTADASSYCLTSELRPEDVF